MNVYLETASTFRSQIDRTTFATVKSDFRHPQSEISQVIVVQQGYLLEDIPALFRDTPAQEAAAVFRSLVESGAIRVGGDDLANAHPWVTFDRLDDIADEHPCRVAYCPPAYFVQLVWEATE